MLILARTRSPRTPVLAVYVRRHSSATVGGVPDGRYVAWDCIGRDWNAHTRGFLTTEEYSRWRDALVFSTVRSAGHVRWRNWTLTLGSGGEQTGPRDVVAPLPRAVGLGIDGRHGRTGAGTSRTRMTRATGVASSSTPDAIDRRRARWKPRGRGDDRQHGRHGACRRARGSREAGLRARSFLRLPSRLALTGIRTRILLGFVVMLAIATVASVVVAREVLQSRLHERIDADLAQEVKELGRIAAGKDPATARSFGQNVDRIFRVYFDQNSPSTGEVVLTFVKGTPFLRSRSLSASYRLDRDAPLVSHWKGLAEPERDSVDTPAGRVEYLAVPVKGDGRVLGTFVVAAFTDVLQHPYNDAFVAAGVVGVAVLLIGSLLAWRMAESVLRPVSSLTQTAQSISETDLTQRIEVRGHDELAGLAATLNAMLDRLERTLSSQRRFLDDAGHELRTPITIIRGHLELLEDDPEERQATLALVMDELDRMGRMVNDLILLSKAERPDFLKPEAVEVAGLTDEVLTKARALGARDWQLDAHGDGVVTVDRQRLSQALMQLAQNAVEHTQEGDTGLVRVGRRGW